jgi:hypothetical protein
VGTNRNSIRHVPPIASTSRIVSAAARRQLRRCGRDLQAPEAVGSAHAAVLIEAVAC